MKRYVLEFSYLWVPVFFFGPPSFLRLTCWNTLRYTPPSQTHDYLHVLSQNNKMIEKLLDVVYALGNRLEQGSAIAGLSLELLHAMLLVAVLVGAARPAVPTAVGARLGRRASAVRARVCYARWAHRLVARLGNRLSH